MKKQLTLVMGALADSISDQLKDAGFVVSKKDADTYDAHAKAIVRLHIHGIITDSMAHRARQKLTNKISANLRLKQ